MYFLFALLTGEQAGIIPIIIGVLVAGLALIIVLVLLTIIGYTIVHVKKPSKFSL